MSVRGPLRCRVLGCHWLFGVEGADLVWQCRRCARTGRETYDDVAAAKRMARVCNRGAPKPPTGMLAALGGTVHDERRRG